MFTSLVFAQDSLSTLMNESQKTIIRLKEAEFWIDGAVIITNASEHDMQLYGVHKDSHMEIGSVSKSFTGILLAWLVKTNIHVHLTDPVSLYVFELQGSFAGTITLEQLATQKSGLPASFSLTLRGPVRANFFT